MGARGAGESPEMGPKGASESPEMGPKGAGEVTSVNSAAKAELRAAICRGAQEFGAQSGEDGMEVRDSRVTAG